MTEEKELLVNQRVDKASVPHHLARMLMKKNQFAILDGKLCLYDSSHNYWRNLKDEGFDKCIRLLIPDEYKAKCNHGVIVEIMRWLEAEVKVIKLQSIPERNYYINFRNGCINVRNFKVLTHTPELDFMHYVDADIPPQESWKKKKIEKAAYSQLVNSVFSGKYKELRLDFEELIGLILSPQRSLKLASIFWGKPNTGKSVALNMIGDMLDESFVSNVSFSQFSDEFAVACLSGKALNVSGEISGIREKRLDLFNSIVGNDSIMVCYKGQDYFKLKSNAFLAFACNDLPNIPPETVDAFKTRIVIIPFMNEVSRENWIPDMNLKIRGEKEMISAMAIMGLQRFIANGNRFTHQVLLDEIKESVLCELNTFRSFAKCKLVESTNTFTSSNEIQMEYEKYCEENDVEAYAALTWSRALRKMFPKVRKMTQKDDFGTQKRGYRGIALRRDTDVDISINNALEEREEMLFSGRDEQ